MAYLLDTCVLSEFVKAEPSAAAQAWIARQNEETLFMAAISLAELHRGVARLPDSRRKTDLDAWLARLEASLDKRILPFTQKTAAWWGHLYAAAEIRGQKPALADSLIAATALEHGLTLVTRNEKDFTALPVLLLNPWNAPD